MTTSPAPVKNFNVPNTLSAIRLLLSFAVVALLPMQLYLVAFVLFVIAAGTDWIDGWYARKFKQITQLGRILDPFCDKMIICGTFISLAVEMKEFPWYASITGWLAVLVMGREMLVTALRSFIESAGGDFSAKMAGKLKMVFQCIAAGAGFVALLYAAKPESGSDFALVPNWVVWILAGSVWLTIIFTLYSGAEYVVAAIRFAQGKPSSKK